MCMCKCVYALMYGHKRVRVSRYVCIYDCRYSITKDTITRPLGRGTGVFREFEMWPKFYLWSRCAGRNTVLYCTANYRKSIVHVYIWICVHKIPMHVRGWLSVSVHGVYLYYVHEYVYMCTFHVVLYCARLYFRSTLTCIRMNDFLCF